MKRILAIDTCGSEGSVQIFDLATGDVLGQATLPGRETQEKLLPAVEQVLNDTGCSPIELFALAVVVGPGSFTGVRIGLAAVKGLAEATGVPVLALSRLAVLAGAFSGETQGRVHAWLDAGRADVYSFSTERGEPNRGAREVLISGSNAGSLVGVHDVVVALEPALLDRYPDLLPNTVLVSAEDYLRSLRTMARHAAGANNFAEIALLDANYLRIPDAEMARKANAAQDSFPTTQASI